MAFRVGSGLVNLVAKKNDSSVLWILSYLPKFVRPGTFKSFIFPYARMARGMTSMGKLNKNNFYSKLRPFWVWTQN